MSDVVIKKYEAKGYEKPLGKKELFGFSTFAGASAGENVAGTEFVIGATFVTWGVSAESVIFGLLIGNLLAVLNWRFLCAPIAVETRLTLYGYLKKIAGTKMTAIYNTFNAVLFCVLSGAMITVSASAIRVLFNIPPQIMWYPTSVAFVAIVLIIGFVVAVVAVLGFKGIALFSSVCSPWLMVVFVLGALVSMPLILNSVNLEYITSFRQFMDIANQAIWVEKADGMGFWTVAAFAWVCNLAFNAGLSDMAVFRYAKNSNAGYATSTGMLLGHYVAWVAAGIMGAGAALALKSDLVKLDPGSVAFSSLGLIGILAVILAGWTTSNPSLYRAGLAFQAIFKNYSIKQVTFITGIVTALIACFPFAFSQLLNFVGYMGILLVPVGSIVMAEHYIFPKIGLTRYWSSYKGQDLNLAALFTWLISASMAVLLNSFAIIGLFFLFVPIYILSLIIYIVLASVMGAKEDYRKEIAEDKIYNDYIAKTITKEDEKSNIQDTQATKSFLSHVLYWLSVISLLVLLGLGLGVYMGDFNTYSNSLLNFKNYALLPTLCYFIFSTWYLKLINKEDI